MVLEEVEEVLVVEDEDEAREFLIQIFEIEGFAAHGAANGSEGLAYLRQARPCLIVLDVLMPVMNGRQFREALLRDPELAKIPVVVVTALEPASVRDMLAVDVLRKPLDVDKLLEVVRANC